MPQVTCQKQSKLMRLIVPQGSSSLLPECRRVLVVGQAMENSRNAGLERARWALRMALLYTLRGEVRMSVDEPVAVAGLA